MLILGFGLIGALLTMPVLAQDGEPEGGQNGETQQTQQGSGVATAQSGDFSLEVEASKTVIDIPMTVNTAGEVVPGSEFNPQDAQVTFDVQFFKDNQLDTVQRRLRARTGSDLFPGAVGSFQGEPQIEGETQFSWNPMTSFEEDEIPGETIEEQLTETPQLKEGIIDVYTKVEINSFEDVWPQRDQENWQPQIEEQEQQVQEIESHQEQLEDFEGEVQEIQTEVARNVPTELTEDGAPLEGQAPSPELLRDFLNSDPGAMANQVVDCENPDSDECREKKDEKEAELRNRQSELQGQLKSEYETQTEEFGGGRYSQTIQENLPTVEEEEFTVREELLQPTELKEAFSNPVQEELENQQAQLTNIRNEREADRKQLMSEKENNPNYLTVKIPIAIHNSSPESNPAIPENDNVQQFVSKQRDIDEFSDSADQELQQEIEQLRDQLDEPDDDPPSEEGDEEPPEEQSESLIAAQSTFNPPSNQDIPNITRSEIVTRIRVQDRPAQQVPIVVRYQVTDNQALGSAPTQTKQVTIRTNRDGIGTATVRNNFFVEPTENPGEEIGVEVTVGRRSVGQQLTNQTDPQTITFTNFTEAQTDEDEDINEQTGDESPEDEQEADEQEEEQQQEEELTNEDFTLKITKIEPSSNTSDNLGDNDSPPSQPPEGPNGPNSPPEGPGEGPSIQQLSSGAQEAKVVYLRILTRIAGEPVSADIEYDDEGVGGVPHPVVNIGDPGKYRTRYAAPADLDSVTLTFSAQATYKGQEFNAQKTKNIGTGSQAAEGQFFERELSLEADKQQLRNTSQGLVPKESTPGGVGFSHTMFGSVPFRTPGSAGRQPSIQDMFDSPANTSQDRVHGYATLTDGAGDAISGAGISFNIPGTQGAIKTPGVIAFPNHPEKPGQFLRTTTPVTVPTGPDGVVEFYAVAGRNSDGFTIEASHRFTSQLAGEETLREILDLRVGKFPPSDEFPPVGDDDEDEDDGPEGEDTSDGSIDLSISPVPSSHQLTLGVEEEKVIDVNTDYGNDIQIGSSRELEISASGNLLLDEGRSRQGSGQKSIGPIGNGGDSSYSFVTWSNQNPEGTIEIKASGRKATGDGGFEDVYNLERLEVSPKEEAEEEESEFIDLSISNESIQLNPNEFISGGEYKDESAQIQADFHTVAPNSTTLTLVVDQGDLIIDEGGGVEGTAKRLEVENWGGGTYEFAVNTTSDNPEGVIAVTVTAVRSDNEEEISETIKINIEGVESSDEEGENQEAREEALRIARESAEEELNNFLNNNIRQIENAEGFDGTFEIQPFDNRFEWETLDLHKNDAHIIDLTSFNTGTQQVTANEGEVTFQAEGTHIIDKSELTNLEIPQEVINDLDTVEVQRSETFTVDQTTDESPTDVEWNTENPTTSDKLSQSEKQDIQECLGRTSPIDCLEVRLGHPNQADQERAPLYHWGGQMIMDQFYQNYVQNNPELSPNEQQRLREVINEAKQGPTGGRSLQEWRSLKQEGEEIINDIPTGNRGELPQVYRDGWTWLETGVDFSGGSGGAGGIPGAGASGDAPEGGVGILNFFSIIGDLLGQAGNFVIGLFT